MKAPLRLLSKECSGASSGKFTTPVFGLEWPWMFEKGNLARTQNCPLLFLTQHEIPFSLSRYRNCQKCNPTSPSLSWVNNSTNMLNISSPYTNKHKTSKHCHFQKTFPEGQLHHSPGERKAAKSNYISFFQGNNFYLVQPKHH